MFPPRASVKLLLVVVPALAPGAWAAGADHEPAAGSERSLARRVADRRIVERFYWSKREWPGTNKGEKPPFERTVPPDVLRYRAEDSLRKSAALEQRWGITIGPRELQLELDRMARDTRVPERLRELWRLLDNDADRIAEAVARPLLADRRLREEFRSDPSLHRATDLADRPEGWVPLSFQAWWESARNEYPPERISPVTGLRLPPTPNGEQAVDTWVAMDPDGPLGRAGHSAVWTGSEMIIWGGVEGGILGDGARYDPVTDTWSAMAGLGAPAPRTNHVAFWTGTEMIVWGGSRRSEQFQYPGPGARYDPSADAWLPMNDVVAPTLTSLYSAVWTGTEMIIWGGYANGTPRNIGARYSPTTDTWTRTQRTGAPSPRGSHSAVWSGTKMIIWGGWGDDGSGPAYLDSGGCYDPGNDTWAPISGIGAPSARFGHSATWDGSSMIIWGGWDSNGYTAEGARYNLQNNQWNPMTNNGAPAARGRHTAIWTGARLVVWAGEQDYVPLDSGGRYDPVTDVWDGVGGSQVPAGRYGHTAVWTGSEMIVWGGYDSVGPLDTGGRYDPVHDTWQPVVDASERPGARVGHVSVWTGSELIVWGGEVDRGDEEAGGARYDPVTDAWTPTSAAGAPTVRAGATAVWSGDEVIVWGGWKSLPGTGQLIELAEGGRYDPAGDSWSTVSSIDEPEPRHWHTAVWTGTEMIVWGGYSYATGMVTDGRRYSPPSDAWLPMNSIGEPAPRVGGHTAVWTGSEMIIFGGGQDNQRTGGRYRPDLDLWRPTSEVGVIGRTGHDAVWTGSEMIVWGGSDNAGGRYDPFTDAWTAVPSTDIPASSWDASAAWACGSLFAWGPDASSLVGAGARYDPMTNVWAPISSTGAPLGLSDVPAAVSDTSVLLFGGLGGEGFPTASGGIYRACQASPGIGPIAGLSLAPGAAGTRIAWYSAPTVTGYDVVRGDLETLRSTGGDFAAATDSCRLANGDLAWIDDATVPADGSAFWYLSRARRDGEVGTYDSGGFGQVATRDPGIEASGVACPP